jgi:serum/glucocorticoid-regulated kinase 2
VESAQIEHDILKRVKHPNLTGLRYAFQSTEKLYLLMDYYIGGNLYHHLKKNKQFTQEQTRFYMAQVLEAIRYLHRSHIAYRDIKLENILMDQDGYVALTDFGLSQPGQKLNGKLNESQQHLGMTNICGTMAYMAPEMMLLESYTKTVDWWSYGILLYEMLQGKPPSIYQDEEKVSLPDSLSRDAKDLLSKLLEKDPSKRLGVNGGEEIMAHPFFASINWQKLKRKELKAPFVPTVDDAADTRYMRNEQPMDSFVTTLKDLHHFDKFFDSNLLWFC